MTILEDAYAAEGIPAPRSREEHDFQRVAWLFTKAMLPGVPVWSIDCGWPGMTEKDNNIRRRRARRGVPPGLPDLWVMLHPVFTFETKADKGALSDAQLARRDELIRAGHYWFGPITKLEQIEAALRSKDISVRASCGIVVPVPQVSKRREEAWRRLHDPVPEMGRNTGQDLLG